MTRRHLILIGLLLLLLAGAFGLWFLYALPTNPATQANAQRIKPGMTLAEAEGILGKSANGGEAGANPWACYAEPHMLLMWSFRFHGVIYEAELRVEGLPGDHLLWFAPESAFQFWCGRDGAAVVRLDASRRVAETRWLPARVSPTYQPDTMSYLKRLWGERFTPDPPKGVP